MKCIECKWYKERECFYDPPRVLEFDEGVRILRPLVGPDDYCSKYERSHEAELEATERARNSGGWYYGKD